MTKVVCDRCGQEINTNDLTALKFPLLKIEKWLDVSAKVKVDLCQDCTIDFSAWLRMGRKENR